jgi:hypothetical protein
MDIQEIQKAKQQLESGLRENIRVFEKETGVYVSCVLLDRFNLGLAYGEPRVGLGAVRCDVRL